MPAVISFISTDGASSINVQLISDVRVTESKAIPGTTTAAAVGREAALIVNTEASAIMVAWGTTPDAAALAKTALTTAGVCIPSGQSIVVALPIGAKINAKVAS